uniref:Transposase n=1 Tax=Heterorhabditis bacteriophora TaxID=37862 RepID=A0A1I7XAF6_HETBA
MSIVGVPSHEHLLGYHPVKRTDRLKRKKNIS